MMSDDRGNAVGAMRSSTSCGRVMRSSAAVAPWTAASGPNSPSRVSLVVELPRSQVAGKLSRAVADIGRKPERCGL
jgi:hypothetical protein